MILVQGWVGQTVLEMDKTTRIVSIGWEEIEQHRIKVWAQVVARFTGETTCRVQQSWGRLTVVCMQMTQLEGFLQEQTEVPDGLLSTPCTVRCMQQSSTCRARTLCARGADHPCADGAAQVLLCVGKGGRVLGCGVLEASPGALRSGSSQDLQPAVAVACCGNRQLAELRRPCGAVAHAATPAVAQSHAVVLATDHAREPGKPEPPPEIRPNVLTKWLSMRASPIAAQACEPKRTSPANADQLHSGLCRSAGRAATCETGSLGVRLLWADAGQQPDVVRKRLLWHLRRQVAGR